MGKEIPVHVSIIMDGNGRWARERGKERVFGHLNGVGSVRAVAEAAAESGVKYLSLYAFSEENWGRPEAEVQYLMGLMMKAMGKEVDTLMKNDIRFRVLGNRARLSDELNDAIDGLERQTAGNQRMTLVVFLSYSGRWDILQAAKRLARQMRGRGEDEIEALTMEDFSASLVTSDIPDPDLIIRTSGEQRISNYLLWQGAYSELLFVDKMWPEFRKEDFRKALEDYAARDRRYGKVK